MGTGRPIVFVAGNVEIEELERLLLGGVINGKV
jgi:hypothetical protein